ncbi:DUF4097 family beta strand repeat-containing protein [Staphylococcus hyicus]|uniref:DUF4097 family beta strand repeat-containing protein n=1 Tax=Staphylococcus hyicus TaxID=1284 RepID=UPI00057D63B6|nr:DUF4097 family beta strand repeat-containing protein [Staphylococcus hyicus]AJC95628.1 hypothetical protein SHYC_04195 [Staphylococcus hyicus]RTX65188.1 hypothetical protein EKQ60_11685 [Staphylococcus hyicus]SQE47126.1 exported protein [Staphylococcus hyicus]
MKRLFLTGLTMFLVFFSLGSIVWFLFEAHHSQTQTTEKAYKSGNIERLNVDANNADVYIKKGQHFHVNYDGKAKINISKQNETLQISDSQASRKRMLDVNPFNKSKERLEITIPDKELNELNITTRVGEAYINDVKSRNVMIWYESTGQINIDNCYFDRNSIKAKDSLVNISDSNLSDSDISVLKGKITVNQTLVRKSVFKVNEGSMVLNNMKPECDFKGSVNHGDISMHYVKPPKDVMLKLTPEKGNINVNASHLHQGKNGKGTHLIELYTNHGDININ